MTTGKATTVARRTLIGAAAATLLTACSSEQSRSADLQKQFAREAGVTSVTLTTYTPNESIFLTYWKGEATLADDLSGDEQGRLLARFFELATAAGLTVDHMSGVTFHLPAATSVSVSHLLLDANQAAEAVQLVHHWEGATATVGTGIGKPSLWVRNVVSREEALDVVRSAASLEALVWPASFTTEVSLLDGKVPDGYTVWTDRPVSASDLSFMVPVGAWLTAYGAAGFTLGFTSTDRVRLVVDTSSDESASLKGLIQTANAMDVSFELTATRVGQSSPYLTSP